jgi:hypothetical protein
MQMISFITWLVFPDFPSQLFATSQQAFSAAWQTEGIVARNFQACICMTF